MADNDNSRVRFSLQTPPRAEETHLLDSQTTDDNTSPPSGGLLSSSSIFRRDGYQPMPSGAAIDLSTLNGGTQNQHSSQTETSDARESNPLGISVKGVMNCMSLSRVPVGSKSSSPATPRSNQGFLSSPESGTTSPRREALGSATLSPNPDQRLISPLQSPLPSPNAARTAAPRRQSPMRWDDPPRDATTWHVEPIEEEGDLGRGAPTKDESRQKTTSLSSHGHDRPGVCGDHGPMDDEEDLYKRFSQPPTYCDSRKDVHRRRANWLSISIIALSIYSTGLSCLWFVVAVVQPRWGRTISSSGGILPSTASTVFTLFAKTIEISFVTVFVAFIGQVLTRRSFVKKSKGMTLSEMTMRNWVIQPGFLITHWETIPYAAVSFLGSVSLIATLASTFYTTASDAMVTPKLKFGDWETRTLNGYVLSSYANTFATQDSCPTPLRDMDPDEVKDPGTAARSCLDITYAGQSYRNLVSFLTDWEDIKHNGTATEVRLSQRPVGTTLLYDNTTLTSTWIHTEFSNVTQQVEKNGRIINNVTLAMPHPGVYDAATHPVNEILQPNDLSGVGEYAIKAGVVSPSLNVMCVNMSPEDLEPLVYTAWPHSNNTATNVGNQTIGHDGWLNEVPAMTDNEWYNATNVDDIFHWGRKYGRRPPVFQLYPADFNMITNSTIISADAMYILAKSPFIANYTLCEMRSWVTPVCSTHFNISGTAGAHMRAHCQDDNDPDSYQRSIPDDAPEVANTDWKFVADQWRTSMDINGGVYNNNASNARTLTQFILQEGKLNPLLPSMAEALAVFASSTLIIGSIGTPFMHFWNYTDMQLGAPGMLNSFHASIREQQYTSSHINQWQKIFYVILVVVFVINVFCLSYFLSRSGLVTDYTEPQNLFTLAVNSPPSEQLKGSCGGGPVQRDLVVPWRVAYAKGSNHYYFEEANDRPWHGKFARQEPSAEDFHLKERSSYKRLSTSRTWL